MYLPRLAIVHGLDCKGDQIYTNKHEKINNKSDILCTNKLPFKQYQTCVIFFSGLLMSVSKAADVLYAHFEKSKDTFDKVCVLSLSY